MGSMAKDSKRCFNATIVEIQPVSGPSCDLVCLRASRGRTRDMLVFQQPAQGEYW